jgi:hypothetical protein
MWIQLEALDIEKARQHLRERLAETVSRHAEQAMILQQKQAGEIRQLEAKQHELDTLYDLIDRFADEFQSTAPNGYGPPFHSDDIGPELLANTAGTEQNEPSPDESATQHSGDEAGTVNSGSFPEKLALGYASPNFRSFRRFGS